MRPPDSWSRARVTLVLTIATAAAWLIVAMLRLDAWAIDAGAFVPAHAPPGADPGVVPWWLTPLTAAFVHGGLIHLAFNLLILAFCGRPTEAVVGPLGIVILYVVGAYAAAGAQYLLEPGSAVPMIGASGAISAVLGAYAILFGRNRVKVASPTLALWLNALWLMAAWIVLQVIVGYTSASFNVGIAFAAHIGGFIVGVALANPLLLIRYRRA